MKAVYKGSEMSRPKLSKKRQAIWSRKMKALGKCPRCGKKRRTYKHLCDRCTVLFSIYLKQWRKRKKAEAEMEKLGDHPTANGPSPEPSGSAL
jgi:predicted amidophosphoribosyltransferase